MGTISGFDRKDAIFFFLYEKTINQGMIFCVVCCIINEHAGGSAYDKLNICWEKSWA